MKTYTFTKHTTPAIESTIQSSKVKYNPYSDIKNPEELKEIWAKTPHILDHDRLAAEAAKRAMILNPEPLAQCANYVFSVQTEKDPSVDMDYIKTRSINRASDLLMGMWLPWDKYACDRFREDFISCIYAYYMAYQVFNHYFETTNERKYKIAANDMAKLYNDSRLYAFDDNTTFSDDNVKIIYGVID